jgi:CheY-like chemotaxis protein
MDPAKILEGKRILVVDDEKDVLEFIAEALDMCKVDTASTYDEAVELLGKNLYHVAILDIMGVRGYDLLDIARSKDIPALMLTAHALSKDSLKKSVERGASYYVPKDEMHRISYFLADILEAREKNKNVWVKWYERMSGFCDRRFGPGWREEEPEFWDVYLRH